MTALVGWATLCGVALGGGLWLLVSMMPRLSRPSLALRVAPYVADLSPDARVLLERRTANPLPVFGMVLEVPLRHLRQAVHIFVGGSELTSRRLRQAGVDITVDAFRARQLTWAAAATAVTAAMAFLLSVRTQTPVPALVGACVLAPAAGFFARDYALQRRAAARIARLETELPTVLEFLTLSLSAGEGILDALRRISRVSRGELAAELATVTSAVASGLPLSDTLAALARQLDLPAFTRAVEQVTGALERGTPLAEVLRAQAQDSREDAKRDLLELSGKKEVAMLVPLIFIILPMTVLFAIFPGVFVLQFGF